MTKKILISIDHKWRDLPGYVLLGEFLSSKGANVYFCRNGLERYFLENDFYDCVIINHILEESQRNLIKEHSPNGVRFVILPTEGIPTLEHEDFTDFALGVGFDYTDVALYVFWNSHYTKRFKKNLTLNSEKIYVAGVPRFDFYKDPILRQMAKFQSGIDNQYKKVLWATNFTQAQFNTPEKFSLLESDATRLGYKTTLERIQGSLHDMAEKDYYARDKSLKIMMKFLSQHPDAYLIIKPHPSEDAEYYENFLRKNRTSNQRVRIVKNEYIWALLNWCDVEVSRSCTTAAEAWLLHKPTIDLNPEKPWFHSDMHSSGSYNCKDYSELKTAMDLSFVDDWHGDDKMMSARSKFIETYCEGSKGNRTHALAQVIYDLIKNNKKQNFKKPFMFKSWFIYILLKYADSLPHSIKVYGLSYLLGNRLDKLGRTDKHFHQKDIKRWKKIINGALG